MAEQNNKSAMADKEETSTMDYVSVKDPSQHTADTEELIKTLQMDPYNEDEAELRFLLSKPTCFIIIGKPGTGKTSLARRLASEWKCELINATDLINQHIELQSEMGGKLTEILYRGEALPESLVIKLIEDKVNSPEVAHHGYILDDFPCLSESYISVRDQMELVKNWKLRPDFIINLKIPDNDIERRRINQKIDPVTGEIYTKEVYSPEKLDKMLTDKDGEEEGEEEEEEEDEDGGEEEMEEEILPSEVIERLIKRPEDLEQQVTDNILKYKTNMLRILEDYMADHDQQYLIEMDSNQNGSILFKQLLTRLNCFVLRPAAVPIRLWDPEDEEIPDEIDTDELMRQLAPKHFIGPRYRWRRSRWLKTCPVALFEGNLTPGKPEFAVSFLDKIYCLSTAEAMEKFLKNPRPYLLPEQPRPPCKFSVLGPPLSGKTTLCHLLANKYGAKVLDVDELMKPILLEEKQKHLQKVREETTETAIFTVRTKIREQLEAEREAEMEAKAAAESELEEAEAEAEVEGEGEDDEDGEEKTGSPKEEEKKVETPATPVTTTGDASLEKVAEPVVDGTHADVITIVEAAVNEAKKQEVHIQPEIYIDMMETAIKDAERELKKNKPDGPMNGGWILDNFPNTRDQWAVCIEKNILPDDVIILRDNSENGVCLMERFYNKNKTEIDEKMKVRIDKENIEKEKIEAEKRAQEEVERKAAEEAAREKEEEEKQRKLEEGEDATEADGNDNQSENGDEERESPTGDNSKEDLESGVKKEDKVEEEPITLFEKPPVPDGPELDEFREIKKEFEREFPSVQATISGNTSIEPLTIDIEEQACEAVLKDTVDKIEQPLKYQSWERSGIDIDEEEEDMENDFPEEEEEEAEEEEDPSRSKKKQLGITNHFCCVSLKENDVLAPGSPEIAAIYREKIYYFTTIENKDKFVENPEQFLPKTKSPQAPPIRLLILGQKGAGKTLHGRHLAKKLGLFHISFQERLQELIIAKTKRRVGPEYEEEPDPVEDDDESEDGAIIEPDGSVHEDEVKEGESKESGVEAEEEDNEPEFTEDEEAIKANLESDDPLPADVLDNILPAWWHKEPFKSTGFILEGFPRTGDEARYLSEMGLFTDAAVILSVSDADVIGRLLPPKLEVWKVKRDKRLAIKEKRKLKAKKKREAEIQKKREALLRDREERRLERRYRQYEDKMEKMAERAAEGGEDSDADEEEEAEEEEVEEEEEDIEAILAEEFEEEEGEEEEDEELEEDAIDRIRNDLNEVYDTDTNKLDGVQEALTEVLIPRLEVDGGRKPHIIRYMLSKKLRPYVDYRHSLFERVYTVGERMAKRMLQFGYKQPSRFGRWCPVQLKDGECMQPISSPGYPTYPCIYRQHLYYLSSLEARDSFILDPMTYLKQPTPKPVVPIRLAVIGPPKSGKTTLCMRLAEEYGLLRLSIGEAMRSLLSSQPKSDLSVKITDFLKTGVTVPDELAIQALEICLLDMKCQTRGYVLDGYPLTKQQVQLLTERSIIPVRVVELQLDNKNVMIRGTKDRVSEDRLYPVHDSAQILATKLAAYKNNIEDVKKWYKEEHMNFVSLLADNSKWWIWQSVLDVAKTSVVQIQVYLQKVADGLAASINDMCITPNEFVQRLGDFQQYCPVSLALRQQLVDCSTTKSLQYAAEYRGHYYKMAAQKELDQFLAEPEKFVPPLAPHKLPSIELLPKRRQLEDVKNKPIELQQYCPVTYLDGHCRYECIIPGSSEFIVEYKKKFYFCASEEKLLQFMKLPENYCSLKLPHKLPPKDEPLAVNNLPMLGFMEQTVASAIITACTAVGDLKPKYPFLTSSKSALVYVAYHLKAFNPKSSDYVRKKYKQKLEKFEETCHLIEYLGNTMTVRYRDPRDRPSDFDNKLETFFALRGIEPTSTWIA